MQQVLMGKALIQHKVTKIFKVHLIKKEKILEEQGINLKIVILMYLLFNYISCIYLK